MTMAPLSTWFDWPADDPLKIYPFPVRILAVQWSPLKYPELLELGRPTLEMIFRGGRISRQVQHGKIVLYFPERWLSVHKKLALMQALVDLHETHPLQYVHIITGEPIFLSDVTDDMVRADPSKE